VGGWGKKKLVEAGRSAPDFELSSLDGGKKSLKDILSRGPALLAFFKVDCPVCQFTFPFLERLHAGASKDAPQIIAVSQDSASATRQYNQEFGISFPSLLDGKGYPVSNAFGISSVPSLFLIEQDGTVAWVEEGFSRQGLEMLGTRAGAAPFQPGEYVPEWRPG
jgi:peroxiredoxin